MCAAVGVRQKKRMDTSSRIKNDTEKQQFETIAFNVSCLSRKVYKKKTGRRGFGGRKEEEDDLNFYANMGFQMPLSGSESTMMIGFVSAGMNRAEEVD